ncbi:uncharacterized protein LY89DRAFT_684953 [Mollisia scopiformis]|uniref:CENP-V/GFA domain-containing protein n=1 Tax=Mollisia scopiformis TaxID=149040 RepID=A0A194X9W9_MOLSC|nr:uncharacterized protein LY89DRAFT_684953 [Mollisia scopiformis]KUJ16963.1 hypothetical protein LY89DRAFT_684953 [Mollisia scopiformis]
MATLPTAAFKLHGGCFCNAITYTISVPDLTSRPLNPSKPSKPLGPRNEVNARLPCIALDHCTTCRRIPGSILQVWFICPQSWAEFSLQPRSHDTATTPIKISTSEFLLPDKDVQERTWVTGFQSSEFAHRTFCGRCGTHLSFFYTGLDQKLAEEANWGPYFDLVLGSLNKESLEVEGLWPDRQVWVGSGIEWVKQLVAEGEGSLC